MIVFDKRINLQLLRQASAVSRTRPTSSFRLSASESEIKCRSPILELPPELVYRIFELGSPAVLVTIVPRKMKHNVETQTLSQVCSSWRRLIVSDGRLWTTIVLSIDTPDQAPVPRHYKEWWFWRLRNALRQSQPYQLDVFISLLRVSRVPTFYWVDAIRIASGFLAKNSTRIATFNTIEAPLPSAWEVNYKTGRPWDSLVELDMSRIDPRFCDLSPGRFLASSDFNRAPRLRRIRAHAENLFSLVAPWSQITHLSLYAPARSSYTHGSSLQTFRALASSLEYLELGCLMNVEAAMFTESGPIIFSRLRDLSIQDATSYRLEERGTIPIVNVLRCPILESLFLHSIDISNIGQLKQLIERWTCGEGQLSTLILGSGLVKAGRVQSVTHWEQLFCSLPHVQRLVLSGLQLRHPVVHALLGDGIGDGLQQVFLWNTSRKAELLDELRHRWISWPAKTWDAELVEFQEQAIEKIKWMEFKEQTAERIEWMEFRGEDPTDPYFPYSEVAEERQDWNLLVRK